MKSKVTTKPSIEPVSLDEVKASLRYTSSAQDELITQYITDARQMVERYTSRKLITQTVTGYGFPYAYNQDQWWDGYKMGPISALNGRLSHIELDHGPVQSIQSVSTFDISNVAIVYASSNYYLDNYDEDRMPRLEFNENADYPGALRQENNWQVVYVAGYGDERSDVPADIRRAIVLLAGYLWSNRGACSDEGECIGGCGAKSMLDKYRIEYALS